MEFEKLQMIIAEVMSREPEEIRPEMSFVDDLGADSLEVFQIVMGIEDAFDVILEEDIVEKVKSVGELFEQINSREEE